MRTLCLSVLVVLTIGTFTSNPTRAQDPVKAAPDTYKVLLENDRVRVLDIHVKAAGTSPTHSHPAHVVVALTPCKVKFTLPDGKTSIGDMKAGDVVWGEAQTHAAENVGTGECHVLNIELKQPVMGAK